jgi:hypothetical protein
MALRLLPFRDYSEHEVINLFAYNANLNTSADADTAVDLSAAATATSNCDAGVFVKVQVGDLNTNTTDWDPVDVDNATHGKYLGKTDYPHVGANYYPTNTLTVVATAAVTDNCVGITLRQTASRDENGEKLNYYPQKKDELYAVLPGETVPILKRGMVTLTDSALIGTNNAAGNSIVLAGLAGAGQASGITSAEYAGTGLTPASAVGVELGQYKVGTILAKGYRDDAAAFAGTGASVFNTTHVYGNTAFHKGYYYIVDLNV